MKANYTDDTFEDYYRDLIERWCNILEMPFNLDAQDGARENMRDDSMVWDEETMEDTDEPAYTIRDLINEYLYFCLYEDMNEYLENDWYFDSLSPNKEGKPAALAVDDKGNGQYEFFAYRPGDKPYSHYDTTRMDRYVGTYTLNRATGHYEFTAPRKES
jgi:hypothetical protein